MITASSTERSGFLRLDALLRENARRFANKPALVFRRDPVDFKELDRRVRCWAALLGSAGAGRGCRIGILLPNGPESVYAYLAAFLNGATVVPLDYGLKEDEIVSCLEHCGASILIVRPRPDVDLAAVRGRLSGLSELWISGASGEMPEGARVVEEHLPPEPPDEPVAEVQPSDPAMIMYTSGTTGRPEGIQLAYRHLDGSPRAMEHFVDLSERDVKLCPIPFSHIGGFIYIQNCLMFGITLVIMDRFNPVEFLRLVQEYRVTCFHIVPPMYLALLSLKNLEKFDLSSLRWVVVFGAPSSPEMMQRFHAHCPNARLLNGWGMTETSPPNTVTPLDSDNIASVGRPSPLCQIRVIGEDGAPLPAGETGEIVIRGEFIMDGYYRDPELTAATVKDGWLATGDLGRFDADGFLYIVGRKKEMIKVGGQIVFAPEVEAVLLRHEGIAEAAVIGVPDRVRGEAMKAFVVLREGASVKPEDIRYFAREHLAHFKVPQAVEILDALSKNRTGKVDKAALRPETRDSR